MIKASRVFLLLFIVIVTSYYMPRYYWMIFEEPARRPNIIYSIVLNDFIIWNSNGNERVFCDTRGNQYSQAEYEALLPLINYRQLIMNGNMPDSLHGQKLEIKTVGKNILMQRIYPELIYAPQIRIFPLFESNSGRVKLELSDYYLSIDDCLQIFNASSNTINEELTTAFSSELSAKKFVFPAEIISGNPTDRKPFDEGYFVTDSNGDLFHLKMVSHKPFCKKIDLPENFEIKFMVIKERELKEFYGTIVNSLNEVYLLSYDNYKLIKLPVRNYIPETMDLIFFGDLFQRTISVKSTNRIETTATDRDYKELDHHSINLETKYETNEGVAAAILFPFSLTFFESSHYFNFNFKFSGFLSLIGISFFLLLTFGLIRIREENYNENYINFVFVILTGVYGFIAIAAIKNVDLPEFRIMRW